MSGLLVKTNETLQFIFFSTTTLQLRYNFWNSSKLLELTVKHYTGGTEDQELLKVSEGKDHEWTEISVK